MAEWESSQEKTREKACETGREPGDGEERASQRMRTDTDDNATCEINLDYLCQFKYFHFVNLVIEHEEGRTMLTLHEG